jgi:hypothetical protein
MSTIKVYYYASVIAADGPRANRYARYSDMLFFAYFCSPSYFCVEIPGFLDRSPQLYMWRMTIPELKTRAWALHSSKSDQKPGYFIMISADSDVTQPIKDTRHPPHHPVVDDRSGLRIYYAYGT